MNRTPRRLSFAAVFATCGVLLAAPGCVIVADDDEDSSLLVVNDSDFIIVDLRVAPVDTVSFGSNLVPDDLLPGEEVEVFLDCDVYDARITDETGLECFLDGIDLCFDDATWVFRNNTCDVFDIAKKQREAAAAAQAAEKAKTAPAATK